MAEITGKEIAIYSIIGVGVLGLAALIILSKKEKGEKTVVASQSGIDLGDTSGQHSEFASTPFNPKEPQKDGPQSETTPSKINKETEKGLPPTNTNPNANNGNSGNYTTNNGSQNGSGVLETSEVVDSNEQENVKFPENK